MIDVFCRNWQGRSVGSRPAKLDLRSSVVWLLLTHAMSCKLRLEVVAIIQPLFPDSDGGY